MILIFLAEGYLFTLRPHIVFSYNEYQIDSQLLAILIELSLDNMLILR
jgi:hypothetical protein